MSPPDPAMIDRLPPHSIEAEQGVLGCVLLSPEDCLLKCAESMPAGAATFYDLRHQILYRSMDGMRQDGLAIDTLTLSQRLRDAGQLEAVGGLAYLSSLPESTPSVANLEHYLEILTEKHSRREIIANASRLISEAWDESTDGSRLPERAAGIIGKGHNVLKGSALYTMADAEERYSRRCHALQEVGFNLSKWLPSLDRLRALTPGNLAVILAATGVGKTAILSNLALVAKPLPVLFLELELPVEDMFERLAALKTKMACAKVEEAYRGTNNLQGREFYDARFPKLVICDQPRLSIPDIERKIEACRLKIGEQPRLVLLDYLGLTSGKGQSRYDRFSQTAEDLRTCAKSTGTVIVVACQIGRKSAEEGVEVHLTDAKESGSIENSASLVLGAWRDPEETTLMHLRVLKCNKGGSGLQIPCNYNLDTLAITERSRYGND